MKKYILVTGGTKGIGRAIVEKFAADGFHIITCARTEADLISLKLEIEQKYTFSKVFYRATDISDPIAIDAFLSYVRELKVKIDVLINNAGVFIPGKIIDENINALQFMLDNHVVSAYRITKGLVADMIKRKSGHIFMLCSTASIMPYTNGGSYCIAKFALFGLTKVLREELKPHQVKVTAILPGATLTASWQGVDLPAERFMQPEDVAAAISNAYGMSASTVVEEILIRPQLGDIES
jgi:short-subunit dehydrogenase